ncbi:MAG: hypothetical protein ABMA64_36290 [Myxococcota bacterium]
MVKSVETIETLDLDTLARESWAELGRRYDAGTVPETLRPLDGPLVGRMLAVRWTRPLAPALRWLAASRRFVWAGKTWRAATDQSGAGINRVYVPALLGRQDLFPFATGFGPSRLDGRPTVFLDYDLPANPWWIRHIHDEVREVAPGLFLGPAMWKHGAGAAAVLWFALDTRG